jgi:hypothetical protein
MPEAVEGSHFGSADFRVGNKIFATLALQKEGFGVLLLTLEEQAGMVEDEPSIFSPVPGGWGRKGSTRVAWQKCRRTYSEARCSWHGAEKRPSGFWMRDLWRRGFLSRQAFLKLVGKLSCLLIGQL